MFTPRLSGAVEVDFFVAVSGDGFPAVLATHDVMAAEMALLSMRDSHAWGAQPQVEQLARKLVEAGDEWRGTEVTRNHVRMWGKRWAGSLGKD